MSRRICAASKKQAQKTNPLSDNDTIPAAAGSAMTGAAARDGAVAAGTGCLPEKGIASAVGKTHG